MSLLTVLTLSFESPLPSLLTLLLNTGLSWLFTVIAFSL